MQQHGKPALRHPSAGRRGKNYFGQVAIGLLLLIACGWALAVWKGADPTAPASLTVPLPLAPATRPAAFECDGRTRCPQMKSCAEARYFLHHCPGTQMDGDGDGIPCESQHCRS